MREATDLAYWAWTIIANVSEGRWEDQTEEWQEAAKRWRDAFHETLDRLSIIESEAADPASRIPLAEAKQALLNDGTGGA